MKSLYTVLIAMLALFVFASLAVADPGGTWDKKIAGAGRFKVLSQFNDEAVLDKETGRVWQQSPETAQRTWVDALARCYNSQFGSRKGWRLPTVEELASLVDISNISPALPAGHPFTLTSAQEDGFYWSATTYANDTGFAWNVRFNGGNVDFGDKTSNVPFVWCVRGGQGTDGL